MTQILPADLESIIFSLFHFLLQHSMGNENMSFYMSTYYLSKSNEENKNYSIPQQRAKMLRVCNTLVL
jgi:hypothetical protein